MIYSLEAVNKSLELLLNVKLKPNEFTNHQLLIREVALKYFMVDEPQDDKRLTALHVCRVFAYDTFVEGVVTFGDVIPDCLKEE